MLQLAGEIQPVEEWAGEHPEAQLRLRSPQGRKIGAEFGHDRGELLGRFGDPLGPAQALEDGGTHAGRRAAPPDRHQRHPHRQNIEARGGTAPRRAVEGHIQPVVGGHVILPAAHIAQKADPLGGHAMADQGAHNALAGFRIRHGAILQLKPAGGHGLQGSGPVAQGLLPHLGQLIEGSQHGHRIDALAAGRRQRGVGLTRQPGARQAPEPLHELRSKLLWNGFAITDEPIDRVQPCGGVVADVMALNRGAAFCQQLDR